MGRYEYRGTDGGQISSTEDVDRWLPDRHGDISIEQAIKIAESAAAMQVAAHPEEGGVARCSLSDHWLHHLDAALAKNESVNRE